MRSGCARGGVAGKALPRVWLMTDPARTRDLLAVAAQAPRGAGLIYRHFGAADRREVAARLAAACRRRGIILLIGADPALAAAVGAAGVHWPERLVGRELARWRRRRPGWLHTAAAHSRPALAAAQRAGADAAFLSPVLPSRSVSAGAPLGVVRAARWARCAGLPVVALGGVGRAAAARLVRTGFAGWAGVDAAAAFRSGTRIPA